MRTCSNSFLAVIEKNCQFWGRLAPSPFPQSVEPFTFRCSRIRHSNIYQSTKRTVRGRNFSLFLASNVGMAEQGTIVNRTSDGRKKQTWGKSSTMNKSTLIPHRESFLQSRVIVGDSDTIFVCFSSGFWP